MSIKAVTNQFATAPPRSSPGLFTNKISAARLLSMPASAVASTKAAVGSTRAAVGSAYESALDSASAISASASDTTSGPSFWRYFFVFLILFFLGLNLVLFLIKPADTDISHLYDPVADFLNAHVGTNFNGSKKGPIVASVSNKNNTAAVKKLEKTLEEKSATNIYNKDRESKHIESKHIESKHIESKHIESKQAVNLAPEPVKKYKKLPVIPKADDSTSRVQMNPSSKSGFCYIGEDRGFRSCIKVGEGDVCMSGNIFPTEAICINPKLRE